MTLSAIVAKSIEAKQLLAKGDSLLIALSAGPDSVALLHLLSRWRHSKKLRLSAVYVNHQIRKRAALEEERFCRRLCERLRVELTVVREDVPALAKKRRIGLEEAARDFRYAAFDRLADERAFDKIALGHHADDQVETILFRFLRGSGPDGLTGMPARRGRFIRPLLDCTRADILDYLRKHRLDWCEDRSNRALKFSRNYIRHKLLPAIRERLNPAVDRALLQTADILAAEIEFLESLVERHLTKCVTVTPGGKIVLALDVFRRYDLWLRRRLLRRCLKVTWPETAGKVIVARLDSLAGRNSGAVALPGGWLATVVSGRLYLYRPRTHSVNSELVPGQPLCLEWPAVTLRGRVVKRSEATLAKRRQTRNVLLDWKHLEPPLVVRSVRPGDRFQPLGMRGTKKIADYLADRRVPRPVRDEALVLMDRSGPVWLVGWEIDDRVKIVRGTRKVLSVAYSVRRKTPGPTV